MRFFHVDALDFPLLSSIMDESLDFFLGELSRVAVLDGDADFCSGGNL